MVTPQFLKAIHNGIKKNSTQSFRLEVIFQSRAILKYAVHTKIGKIQTFAVLYFLAFTRNMLIYG